MCHGCNGYATVPHPVILPSPKSACESCSGKSRYGQLSDPQVGRARAITVSLSTAPAPLPGLCSLRVAMAGRSSRFRIKWFLRLALGAAHMSLTLVRSGIVLYTWQSMRLAMDRWTPLQPGRGRTMPHPLLGTHDYQGVTNSPS